MTEPPPFALPAGSGAPSPQFTQPQFAAPQYQGQGQLYPPQQPQMQPPSANAFQAPTLQAPPHAVTPPPAQLKKKKQLEDTVLVTTAPDQETQDGRIRNPEAAQKIRDTWIYKQVRNRQDEFTQYRKAKVFCGTWNVNAKMKEDPLDGWLRADWAGPETAPDVVCIGFQEIVDLNAVNVAVDNKTQKVSQYWVERLYNTLNQYGRGNDGYTCVSQKSLVGLLICVFVKNNHRARVRYISDASVGVGVMGFAGNKGGVSIRLQFHDSTLCFVCSHLAAHRENVTGRNKDFAAVYGKTSFEVGADAIREVIRSGALSHWDSGSSAVGIADHDIVFWLGDLNYRIDESIPTEEVLKLSENGGIHQLRPMDQLNIERAAGRVFEDFNEGQLNFAPTYKYQPGTDMYEQRPEKKLRAPAWCDRILWRAQVPAHVEQFTYGRSETPNVSDHKPVFSTFVLTIKDVIQQKREAIYTELMHLLDRYENQTLPTVGLDRVTLDFGEVRYLESKTLPIRVTNTGNVVAQFRLKPKLDEKDVCKQWMSVSPMFGMLIPGEGSATMNFTLTINNNTAQMLNSGREVLEDILILGLEGGRDYYVSIKANYARSCFGMSVDELVLYHEPVRSVPLDPIKRAGKMDSNVASALCVPKELWRLIDAIYEKGLDTPYVFVDAGVPDEIARIRESLDTGDRFGQFRIHSYAETLTLFLESLSSPIVPENLFPSLEIDSQNIQPMARRILEELSPIHYNVFVYVVSFFRETLMYRQRNHLTAAKLARTLCDCLSPGKGLDNSSASEQKRTGMQLIMLHMLETSSI